MHRGWLIALVSGIVAAAQAGVVCFSAEEGYGAGKDLISYIGWNGKPGNVIGESRVDGGYVRLSPEKWRSAMCREGVASGWVTCSIEFSFREREPDRGNNDVISVMLNNTFSHQGSGRARLDRMKNHDHYRLEFNMPGSQETISSQPLPRELLGLDGTPGAESDRLTLTFTLKRGATQYDWTVVVELMNSEGEVIDRLERSGVQSDAAFYAAEMFYGGVNSSIREEASGVSDKRIYRFELYSLEVAGAGLLG